MEHSIRKNNAELASVLRSHAAELAAMPELQQRLVFAIRARLEMIQPHVDTWPQVWGRYRWDKSGLRPKTSTPESRAFGQNDFNQ